nr:unnamed protein product [Callosobruchus chinensis]
MKVAVDESQTLSNYPIEPEGAKNGDQQLTSPETTTQLVKGKGKKTARHVTDAPRCARRTDYQPRLESDKDNCGVASHELPIIQLLANCDSKRCSDAGVFFLTGDSGRLKEAVGEKCQVLIVQPFRVVDIIDDVDIVAISIQGVYCLN